MRGLLAIAALAFCLPASAQTTPVEQVERAHSEVKAAQEALDRALHSLDEAQRMLQADEPVPASEESHDAHRMPPSALRPFDKLRAEGAQPPAFKALKVADIAPVAAIADPAPYLAAAPVPPSMAPDVVGAFRLVCNVSHLSYDDPIVYPGQPGKAHLHMFFGNTKTDAYSSYASLRAEGGGSCQGGALNRSAYWIPALLTKPVGGQAVIPDFVGLYYKRRPAGDPDCSRAPHRRCAGIPVGLRAIFGTNYVQDQRESAHVRFDCNGEFSSARLAEAAARCRGASHIYARIEAPDCWDGVNLDSEDHQSHLAYMFYDGTRATPRCPETHPVVIPKLSLIVAYAVLAGDTPGTWTFSSDVMTGAEAGTTFHADYMEAWEPETRLTWERNCLDKMLSCSGGDFGNGRIGRVPDGFTFEQRPHLVAVPE